MFVFSVLSGKTKSDRSVMKFVKLSEGGRYIIILLAIELDVNVTISYLNKLGFT